VSQLWKPTFAELQALVDRHTAIGVDARAVAELLSGRIQLVLTSSACPEQYDAMLDGRKVGYLRLRHGYFVVECPDCCGEIVFEAYPNGDGVFEAHERAGHLASALAAIEAWMQRQGIRQ
jgi:hypothetical protein